MEENKIQDKNLDFESESNVIRPLPSSVRHVQPAEDDSKDIDLRSINKEASKLARQFDKGNKQILEDIKKQEKEQKAQEIEQEKEKIIEEQTTAPKQTTKLGFIGILAVPYILVGALLLWSNFFSDTLPNMLSVLTVIFSIAVYAFGAYELFKGIFRASSVKEKVWSIIFGALCIIISALLVIYRNQAEAFFILGVGVLGVCLDFVYLLVLFIRAKKTRYVPYKAVVSFIVFVASVLFIVQSFVSDVNVLNIITGATALVAGTLEFSV